MPAAHWANWPLLLAGSRAKELSATGTVLSYRSTHLALFATMVGKSAGATWTWPTSTAWPLSWAMQARPSLAPEGQGRAESGPASAWPAAASAARDRPRVDKARARRARPAWGRVIDFSFPNTTD